RTFIIGSAAVGGGLALGLRLPFGPDVARAQDGSPEVGVWVAIAPDDTVNIRVVRSEMGQGTITGLAQLVAEELECDWSKVRIEYPTPGESVKRKRAWGDFSTGGSRGIRESHEYVRQGERQDGLRHRPQDARDAQRRHQSLPGLWRHREELRRRASLRHAGRAQSRAGRRRRGRSARRYVVAGEERARQAPRRLGR